MPLTGGVPGVSATGVGAWLRAPVDAVQAPTLSAFGIPITTTVDMAFFPAGHNTRASSPATFYGTFVASRRTLKPDRLLATVKLQQWTFTAFQTK